MPDAPSPLADHQPRRARAAIAALLALLAIEARPARAAAIDRDRATILLADQAAVAAQRSGDGRALGRVLDARFTLTDSAGAVRDKAAVVAAARATAPGDDIAAPQAYLYGGLAAVIGSNHGGGGNADTRYLRVFVRNGGRWLAYAFFETAIQPPPGAAPRTAAAASGRVLPASIPPGGGAGPCDNPCRTIPYAPRSAAERAVVDAYKRVELDSVTGDVAAFAHRLAEELLIVVPNFTGKPVTRDGAVVSHQRMKGQQIYYPPVPVTWASVAVFGTGALMVSRHDQPPDHAKSSILAQVWTLHDGRWQLALSQQIRVAR